MATTTTATTTSAGNCQNNNANCDYWAGRNYCNEQYVAYMTANCKKSCNLCGETTTAATTTTTTAAACENNSRHCDYWAGRNYCTEKYVAYIQQTARNLAI